MKFLLFVQGFLTRRALALAANAKHEGARRFLVILCVHFVRFVYFVVKFFGSSLSELGIKRMDIAEQTLCNIHSSYYLNKTGESGVFWVIYFEATATWTSSVEIL